MSKLNVGVGADFPVDSAEPDAPDDNGEAYCGRGRFRGRHRRYGMHRWRHGPFFLAPLLGLIALIAIISLAVSYPGVVLAIITVAILSFVLRNHRWHDAYGGPYDRDYDWRDRRDDGRRPDEDPRSDQGPQPDAGPSANATGRS